MSIFNVGDKVETSRFGKGKVIQVREGSVGVCFDIRTSELHDLDGLLEEGQGWWVEESELTLISKKDEIKKDKGGVKNMFEKVKGEVTDFIGDNKSVLYWFAIIFVVDFYVFDGKFKGKLETIFDSIIDRVTSVIVKGGKSEV